MQILRSLKRQQTTLSLAHPSNLPTLLPCKAFSWDFKAYRDRNLYEVLGVAPDCTPHELKHAYYEQAKRYHPDTSTKGTEDNEEKFRQVQMAYEILNDNQKRDKYD